MAYSRPPPTAKPVRVSSLASLPGPPGTEVGLRHAILDTAKSKTAGCVDKRAVKSVAEATTHGAKPIEAVSRRRQFAYYAIADVLVGAPLPLMPAPWISASIPKTS